MMEKRYSITEKQLEEQKKLEERLEASAPMEIPSWNEDTSTERRDELDELIMDRFQDILNEDLMAVFDDEGQAAE